MSCAVFPSTYRNLQHGVLPSQCSFLKNVPGTFFNARHQVKAIAIGVSEVNPLVEIGDCSSPLNLHVFVTLFTAKQIGRVNPSYHFYIALYSSFCGKQGITFTRPVFFVEIDHDDGTVNTNYAMHQLDMNNLMIGISSIDIQVDTVLIASSNSVYS